MAKKQNPVGVCRCARCNGTKSSEWIQVGGLTVGIECVEDLNALIERGLKGDDLRTCLRAEYKEFMRVTTVTGMILKGFLQLDDMLSKGKITKETFLLIATKRFRKDRAEQLIASLQS